MRNPFQYKWGALPVWVLVLSVVFGIVATISVWDIRNQIDDWTWIPTTAASIPLLCFALWEIRRESK